MQPFFIFLKWKNNLLSPYYRIFTITAPPLPKIKFAPSSFFLTYSPNSNLSLPSSSFLFCSSIYNQNLKTKTKNRSIMGNAFGFLHEKCCKPSTIDESIGVAALSHDIFQFELTSQVPAELSKHVVSSTKAQANWYGKLLEAWSHENPPPETAEDAARLVVKTLKRHQKADVEGLLTYYGLALPQPLVKPSSNVATPFPEEPLPQVSLPEGVKYELQTLQVDAKAVADGDTITVYVSTTDPRESLSLPKDIKLAAVQRSKAQAKKDYEKADTLHKKIIDSGYRMINVGNKEILARKYRIRLRGIDAPESSMPYGKEAKEELVKLVEGKCLRVLVYGEDLYRRYVGDIYCNNIFVQEVMLKKGLAWHYTAYDKRTTLETWEKEARAKRVGLWASSNPEKPWEWRKNRQN